MVEDTAQGEQIAGYLPKVGHHPKDLPFSSPIPSMSPDFGDPVGAISLALSEFDGRE
jgi:hypothetical protein